MKKKTGHKRHLRTEHTHKQTSSQEKMRWGCAALPDLIQIFIIFL